MEVSPGLIAVIPSGAAQGWEKTAAAIALTHECREIMKTVVASDQDWMPRSNEAGAYFYAVAPAALSAPAPRLSLLSDVADWSERQDGELVRLVLHLDPARMFEDPLIVYECLQRIIVNAFADGVIGVAKGAGLAEKDGWVEPKADGPWTLDPSVLMFRRNFVDDRAADWLASGRFLPYHTLPAGAGSRGSFV